jgi:hypothetical protein
MEEEKAPAWSWHLRPAPCHLATTDREVLDAIRNVFPIAEYQIYDAAPRKRAYMIVSNGDAPPFEVWIAKTLVRGHPEAIGKLKALRPDPEGAQVLEIVRDGLVVAIHRSWGENGLDAVRTIDLFDIINA